MGLVEPVGAWLEREYATRACWSRRVVCCTAISAVLLCSTACLERGRPSPGLAHATATPATTSTVSPSAPVRAKVVEVVDGDTIRVRLEESVHRVRYIGIDAPERDDLLGPAATEANQSLVAGQTVILERDVSDTDDYGRWLRYVYLPDGLFVNAELVRLGLARARAYPPDLSRQAELTVMEEEARAEGRGLWKEVPAARGAGGVRIVGVDKKAELAMLTNMGKQSQDLSGWVLVSERGGEICPLAGTLDGGATLQVWARAEDAHRGGCNCGFAEPIWNNSEPDPAALYDGTGQLVDFFP